jgi:predicted N-acetyltransferase YhbS
VVTIREERPEDIEAIRAVNRRAFGQTQEGQLADALRANGDLLRPHNFLEEPA